MKKNFLVIGLILILSLSFTIGCESKEAKVEKLRQSAQDYLEKGNFEDAIELYNKMLDIQEDELIRNELSEIKYEKESVETTKVFMENLDNLKQDRTRSGITVTITEMATIENDLDKMINEFEKIDDTKDTNIAVFVKEMKDSFEYNMLKSVVENKIKDAGLSEGLAHLDPELDNLNTVVVAQKRNVINEYVEKILEHEIPEKYNKIY